MNREEVTEKQENLLRSLEPYQHYRALLLVDEEEKEQWQLRYQMAAAEKIQILSSQYKKIMFGSSENIEKWQTTITQIVLSNQLPSKQVFQNVGTEICKDVSEAQDGSILGWIEKAGNTETEREYILHLDADGTILAPANSTGLFQKFSNVKVINWGNCFDTKNVTDMNWMFDGCSQLERLDVSGFNTQNVTDMHGMFNMCEKLESLDVSHFDTQNVRRMDRMFSMCKKLESLDVSGFDTQNVRYMDRMFRWCSQLKSLDVSGFDTQNVMDMKWMFSKCNRLENLDVSGFDTQNVTDMDGMFSECTKLERLDVSGFDTRNVTNMRKMFYECTNLTSLNVSGFDLRKVTDIFRMFAGCTNLEKLDVDRFTADCPSLWFHTLDTDYASILFTSPQSNEKWRKRITQIILSDRIPSESALRNSGTDIYKDVSEAKDHSILSWVEKDGNDYILHLDADGTILAPRNSKCLFAGFSKVKIIEWKDCFDTRNVKNMSGIFGRCSNLTRLDVSGLDTHNVTDMSFMFNECSLLESLDLSGFETQNVVYMNGMFEGCSSLRSLNLSGFETQNVVSMSSMFERCSQLKSLDIRHFDTQNVTCMSYMFFYCGSLECLDVSGFDIRNVQTKKEMFDGCDSLPASAKRVGKKGLFHSLKSFLKG